MKIDIDFLNISLSSENFKEMTHSYYFGLVGWLVFMAYQPCWLFNNKFCLYIYIRYIWFVNKLLVGNI